VRILCDTLFRIELARRRPRRGCSAEMALKKLLVCFEAGITLFNRGSMLSPAIIRPFGLFSPAQSHAWPWRGPGFIADNPQQLAGMCGWIRQSVRFPRNQSPTTPPTATQC
jgi:hypothetical protein